MAPQRSAWEEWKDLNRLDTIEKVSLFSIIMGIFVGIAILTGFDVTPEGTVQYALSAIISSFSSSFGWFAIVIGALVSIGFAIYGAIGTIRSIRTIMSYGIPGIVIAASGFSAGLIVMLFTSSTVADYAFVILVLISLLGSRIVSR